MTFTVHTGDALAVLRTLPAESVHCCVTSPPYWGLRDYGVDGQIGLEPTLAEFLAGLVAVFDEVRRVLRKDGTLWVNMGDSFAAGGKGGGGSFMKLRGDRGWSNQKTQAGWRSAPPGFDNKDLLGIPWRLAFALQDAGWTLRSDIVWAKPNPMPESVRDRPSRSHEYLFLLAKTRHYHYDADAIREPIKPTSHERSGRGRHPGAKYAEGNTMRGPQTMLHSMAKCCHPLGRNKRTVWTVAPSNFKGAHFATFPPALVEPCILAGCPVGGVVLDPFTGSGTTGMVAVQHGRSFVGIELNPEYADMARMRIGEADPVGRQMNLAEII